MVHAVLCVGTPGMERPVRWVHVSEIRDVARYLKGGELILTHGLELRNSSQTERRQYIKDISDAGGAGIIIELGRSFHELPHDMIDAANRLKLPLIVLTQEVSFSEVTHLIHT